MTIKGLTIHTIRAVVLAVLLDVSAMTSLKRSLMRFKSCDPTMNIYLLVYANEP